MHRMDAYAPNCISLEHVKYPVTSDLPIQRGGWQLSVSTKEDCAAVVSESRTI
jgi:hypothetical protein